MERKLLEENIYFYFFAAAAFFAIGFYLGSESASHFGSAVSSFADFKKPLEARAGKNFSPAKQFTFELYRNGDFVIDGRSGYAAQLSPSYRDSAFIRSTKPLPKTYKVSAVVGHIEYDLENLEGLRPDPDYEEGPLNENGVYLMTITDK